MWFIPLLFKLSSIFKNLLKNVIIEGQVEYWMKTAEKTSWDLTNKEAILIGTENQMQPNH
jgi:hypothetical protein